MDALPAPLPVAQLFDVYLPNTMNWAYRLLRHTPGARQHVAAHWMVENAYLAPDFEYWHNPLQRALGLRPRDEWQWPQAQRWCRALAQRSGIFGQMLRRRLAEARPALLHAHTGTVACPYLPLLEGSGLPWVVSFYGADFSKIPHSHPAMLPAYRRLFRGAAAVVTSGDRSAEQLCALGCPADKIRLIYLSIDLGQFAFQKREKPPGQLRLAQVATFTAKKGHILTLQAFHRALADCPNMHLLLAGEPHQPALVQEVADYIARHGLAGRVALRGFVPHAELPALLSATDVFVHPSRRAPDGDMEGPVVANMEALATGCPVISTWHGDIPEVVQDGRNGILAAENDVEALRAAICRFYHMGAGEYAAFGEHGRAHVAAHYNVVREGQRLRDLYAEIAGPCA